MRELILQIVNGKECIRAVELALDVMTSVNPSRFETEQFHEALEQLVKDKEIIELEYIIADRDYRLKTIYFKKGTQFPNLGDLIGDSVKNNVDRQSEGDTKISHRKVEGESVMEDFGYRQGSPLFYGQR